MRAAWVIAIVGIAGCAGGKQLAGAPAGASPPGLFCNPCVVPCRSPCVPAAAAKFEPPPGTFTSPQSVRLSTTTSGAVIRYTTDGTSPTEKSPVYTGNVLVAETTTIKAIAQVPGLPSSEVSAATYAIEPPPAAAPPPPTAAPAPAPAPPPVVVTPKRLELEQKVHFETGLATIDPSSESLLDAVAGALQEHPEVDRVAIEGHTDAQGEDALNERLSTERAETVRGYLIDKGVEPDRLEAHGFGSTRPIADNDTPEGREANRRVEFIVVAPGSEREMGTGSSGDSSAGDTGTGSSPSR